MSSERRMYHHYIPRFILRRWSVPGPSYDIQKPVTKSRKKGPPPEYLNIYDLATNKLLLGTETIARSFGIMDMYKDTKHETDVYHIETSLSKLEQAASVVIAKLEKERSQGAVTLKRSEVNTLRKFLFVMGFRNSHQYKSWKDGGLDGQTLQMLKDFQQEHGLASLGDTYLTNLRQLLDAEHWEVENNKKIFWVTRTDYKLDKDNMTLALYEAPPGVEFILTENGFGIWEGVGGEPLRLMCMMMNMPYDHNGSFIYTRVFPLTPKLALILRSTMMVREELDREFGGSWKPNIMGIPLGSSYFAALPFGRTKVTYDPPPTFDPTLTAKSGEDLQEEWIRSLGGGSINARVNDRLTFRCFTLSTSHARMINSLLLENCRERIIFTDIITLYKGIRLGYERDGQLQHKVDYTKLKSRLIDAHRMRQVTPGAESGHDDGKVVVSKTRVASLKLVLYSPPSLSKSGGTQSPPTTQSPPNKRSRQRKPRSGQH